MSNSILLKCQTEQDNITRMIGEAFDYSYEGEIAEEIAIPSFPDDFQIGLIVGSSGSGKTTLLQQCFAGWTATPPWDNRKCIASHFRSYEDAISKLGAVGLNSIPSWLKPYDVLSTGEKFRANMARLLVTGACVDEYTSTVNREVAKSCSMSISKYIRANGLKYMVFCSCHDDIIPYLSPDWVYDTDRREFITGRCLQRPDINIEVHEAGRDMWPMFARFHYLTADLNPTAKCYCATWNSRPVAFLAVMTFPFRGVNNAVREHRLVVLPDFQGMGIGNRFSEAVAEMYLAAGKRYYSKTANPRCGEHRDKSPLWKPTSKNHKRRGDYNVSKGIEYYVKVENMTQMAKRLCYSHEYIGRMNAHEAV